MSTTTDTTTNTEATTMTDLKDYQERISMHELQVGDFLDVIEAPEPRPGYRRRPDVLVQSRVTEWDAGTGVLRTAAMSSEPDWVKYTLRAGVYTAIIRKRAA